MILRVWDNGGKNIELGQVKFIDKGSLRRHSAFTTVPQEMKEGSNSLFD